MIKTTVKKTPRKSREILTAKAARDARAALIRGRDRYVAIPPNRNREQLSQECGVHLRTANRWLKAGKMPISYAMAMAVITDRELGIIDPAWQGWRLKEGELWSPDGWHSSPERVIAGEFLRSNAYATACDLRYLQEQVEALTLKLAGQNSATEMHLTYSSAGQDGMLRIPRRPLLEPSHAEIQAGFNLSLERTK